MADPLAFAEPDLSLQRSAIARARIHSVIYRGGSPRFFMPMSDALLGGISALSKVC